ncbi:Ras-related protein Rab-5C [Tritrichomonas foetus]|uniref:Ras-related protein Rab-5C n=1 Tax=Tritrichomonas foetus TaxID=1144522 RepID=A0A1J4KA17_9EUKA|nr:Ras-related protein Rab-5C [Tritrichomonas foetus]|eukprot:OHT07768.1 Ras-related protein Rab-5C [Tritrichomonas foetus]
MSEKKTHTAKVVLAGLSSVGKTAIVTRYCKGTFGDDIDPTIGASYLKETVETDKRIVSFEIWDTAGQEVYQSLTATFFKEACAAILVYDITNRMTLKGLDVYAKQIAENCPQNCVVAVVGNKNDLDNERQIPIEEGRAYAESIKSSIFIETSALTGENVRILFESIAQCEKLPFNETEVLSLIPAKKRQKCNC